MGAVTTAALPTGTVTFLFTDIEGSTVRWENHPEAMQVALGRHDQILQSAIDGHGGVVFSRMGDGMAAAFASASEAVAAAVAVQDRLAEGDWPEPVGHLAVRMGVHTGEGILADGQYLSQPLNRCARLMAIGHGGQVLISGIAAPLVQDRLPADLGLLDLGEHRLRDLSEPLRVFQVEHHERQERFPPLRSLNAFPGNLPLQVSTFVGREPELARVEEALDAGRIVTLTGVGGVGKTRLALQAAASVLPRFREGAWLVELAPVRDPAEVAGAVAAVFNITPRSGETLPAALTEFFRTKQLLLVIDNCEHVLEAAGDLVDGLQRACAGLVVLATSREGLGLAGEQNLTVPSLGTPAAAADLEEIGRSEAVSLFVQRARGADAGFALDVDNAPVVLQVCRRLDGMPLAIELAAVQIAAMTPAELARGLDHRFETLAGGRRRAVERHQTLRATVDWSYDLLSEPERHLLDRLSVFAGGCTREGAEAVCSGPPVAERELFTLLRRLVAKSLVVAEREAGGTRYRLLETIRGYGEERLGERGETEARRTRHAEYYSEFIGQIFEVIYGPDEIRGTKALVAERENLLSAMTHAIDSGLVDLALRLIPMPQAHGHFVSALSLPFDSLLSLPGVSDHPLYPHALIRAGTSAALQGDIRTGLTRSQEGTAAADRLGGLDLSTERELQTLLAGIDGGRDGHQVRAAHFDRAAEIARSFGHIAAEAILLGGASYAFSLAGDVDAALSRSTEGLALARRAGMPTAIITNLMALANAGVDRDPAHARALLRESMDLQEAPGYESHSWVGILVGAQLAAQLEDWPLVLQISARAINILHWAGVNSFLPPMMDFAARALVELEPEAAAVLGGTTRRPVGGGPPASTPSLLLALEQVRRAKSLLIERLGAARFEELQEVGEGMDHDQAVAYALDVIAKARTVAFGPAFTQGRT